MSDQPNELRIIRGFDRDFAYLVVGDDDKPDDIAGATEAKLRFRVDEGETPLKELTVTPDVPNSKLPGTLTAAETATFPLGKILLGGEITIAAKKYALEPVYVTVADE